MRNSNGCILKLMPSQAALKLPNATLQAPPTVEARQLGKRKARSLSRFLTLAVEVGSRAGAPAVGGGFPVPLFRLRSGFTVPPWPRFQPPPRQTQRAVFPHCAFLLVSCEGLWDLSRWERFRLWPTDPIAVKQAQALLQPLPTPPLPAEAPPFRARIK